MISPFLTYKKTRHVMGTHHFTVTEKNSSHKRLPVR